MFMFCLPPGDHNMVLFETARAYKNTITGGFSCRNDKTGSRSLIYQPLISLSSIHIESSNLTFLFKIVSEIICRSYTCSHIIRQPHAVECSNLPTSLFPTHPDCNHCPAYNRRIIYYLVMQTFFRIR